MYFKITDRRNNVYILMIVKDKDLQYNQKKNNIWRIVNITNGTILIPTFLSSDDAIEFLHSCSRWTLEEVDIDFEFSM